MGLRLPIILINFKTYPSTIGQLGLKLAQLIERVSSETGVNFGVAVAPTDIRMISENTSLPVFAQHFDPYEPGKYTGCVLGEMVKDAGAVGSLINHAEHPVDLGTIQMSVQKARTLNLDVVVCVDNVETAKRVAKFGPSVISLEPPELIGTGVAVSRTKPDVVKKAIEEVNKVIKIPVLCGAGISTREDVAMSLKCGSNGVLIASAITQNADPKLKLKELARGIREGW